jgi:hypothetical protein
MDIGVELRENISFGGIKGKIFWQNDHVTPPGLYF